MVGCQGRTPSKDAATTGPVIRDREWALRELDGQPLDSAALASPPTLLLSSAGTRASAFAGCNRLTGSYTLGSGTLEFGPLALTRMACPSMDLETRYTAALASVRQYRVEGTQLVLLAGDRVVARLDPAPAE
jgi:heat shock protein HslJ